MAISVYKFGSVVTTELATVMNGRALITVTNGYDTFKQFGVHYQVPVGKTLYVTQFASSASSASLHFGYGDNAKSDETTAPTNFVNVMTTSAYAETVNNSVCFVIPASKYPCMFHNASGIRTMLIYGVVL
jgi:hypothetical protein